MGLLLWWRHNERDGVSHHQHHDCLLNRLKKTSEFISVTWLCEGDSLMTGEFPAQRASNAEDVSIWCRHYFPVYEKYIDEIFQLQTIP